MDRTERRERLGNRLLDAVCRSLQWSTDRRDPKARLEAILVAHRVALVVGGVHLTAWLTPDVELAVEVRVGSAADWSSDREVALRRALEAEPGLVAELLLLEWSYVRRVCEAAAAEKAER